MTWPLVFGPSSQGKFMSKLRLPIWLVSGLSLAASMMLSPGLDALAKPAQAPAAASTPPATTPAPPASAMPAVAGSIPSSRYAEKLVVITIDRQIDAAMQASVKRRLDDAVDAKADAIVIELNTPGGQVGAVLGICNDIRACPIKNTIAWVHPAAYSGGTLIALACREIVASDGSTMGNSLVIQVNEAHQVFLLPEGERQKATAPLLAEVVNSARRNGYDEKLVQGFVTLGVELWLIRHKDRPEEILCIGRDEYRVLFGEPPVQEATNSGVKTLTEETRKAIESAIKSSSAPSEKPDAADANRQSRPHNKRPTNPSMPDRPADASPFVPASPAFTGTASRMVDGSMTLRSQRPALTAADGPNYKVIEYVSDGMGVLTLHPAELQRYKLAQRANTGTGTINNDEELKAFTGAKSLARLNMNWIEYAGLFLSHPFTQYVLIAIMLMALFVEMTHPGLFLPGAIAFGAILLLVTPFFVTGLVTWWAIGAVLVGILLIIVEVLILPGFGVPGVLGLLLLFAGLIGLFIPTGGAGVFSDSPEASKHLITAVATVSLATVTAIVGMYFLARNFGSIPLLNRLILQDRPPEDSESMLAAMGPGETASLLKPGDEGTAISPLRPSGSVQIGERIVDVVAEGPFVGTGDRVRVVSASSFNVIVEKV